MLFSKIDIMEPKKRKKTLSFENSIEKLEAIVTSLESGEVPLDQLVETYKEGLTYLHICQSHLDRASILLETLDEKGSSKVLKLSDENGSI